MKRNIFFFFFGIAFALMLSRSGVTDYELVQQMFLLESFELYGFMGVAVLLIAPGIWLITKRGTVMGGVALNQEVKPVNTGNLVGGMLFGFGWSMTGMCPGPILVNIGEGKVYALAAFAGALVGTWLFGLAYDKLKGPMGLADY